MLKSLFLTRRFFWTVATLVVLFVVSFWWSGLFVIVQLLLLFLLAAVLLDVVLLFRSAIRLRVKRKLPKILGLGDETPIELTITNLSDIPLRLEVIDELPYQLQERDFAKSFALAVAESKAFTYPITPTERGEYAFGNTNLLLSTTLGLAQRLYRVDRARTVPVYPSVLQMKQLTLRAFDRLTTLHGSQRLRRIGHSYEFEQIKNYVPGDDYRGINWKASGRRGDLMVNQYEDERAQQVYCIIDKSRTMRMPFGGLSLLDYAINTTLAISNIVLRKYDRAGLITFSDKLGATVKADSRPAHLNKLLQALYQEKQRPVEANFELLYYGVRRLVGHRSLLLLYTNFGSSYALERALPVLRRLNRFHLLVVVFFENTEVNEVVEQRATTLSDIYRQTVAREFLAEKQMMVQKLRQYGIQTVLTRPEDLSVNTLNKYLELKARGLI